MLLVQDGIDMNLKDDEGRTPLSYAAGDERVERMDVDRIGDEVDAIAGVIAGGGVVILVGSIITNPGSRVPSTTLLGSLTTVVLWSSSKNPPLSRNHLPLLRLRLR